MSIMGALNILSSFCLCSLGYLLPVCRMYCWVQWICLCLWFFIFIVFRVSNIMSKNSPLFLGNMILGYAYKHATISNNCSHYTMVTLKWHLFSDKTSAVKNNSILYKSKTWTFPFIILKCFWNLVVACPTTEKNYCTWICYSSA